MPSFFTAVTPYGARARLVDEAGRQYLWFWCAGCQTHHRVVVSAGGWGWNQSVDRPTLTPSVRVSGARRPTDAEALRILDGERVEIKQIFCCHSFVTDGQIRYLGDCTHALKGQTVDLEPIAESMGDE